MQGPFSERMNTAMLRAIGAKMAGDEGRRGPQAASRAATAANSACAFWSSDGPQRRTGSDFQRRSRDSVRGFSFGRVPHVCVVGIGPGSEAAQTGEVRAAIEHTDCLIGAARMLEVAARPGQLRVAAIAPDAIAAAIAAHPECSNFTVLMSGDTGFFQRHEETAPAAAELSCPRVAGVELDELSLRAAREAL